jgi:hypothetical protein
LRTPDWDEVRDFLKYDEWVSDKPRSTDHDHFTKTLPDGEILITRISRAGRKTMSGGRFKAILTDQLRISEAQFWAVLRTKTPATRPEPRPDPEPRSLPLWLAHELERHGVVAADLEHLDQVAAEVLLADLRSRPGS